MLRLRIILKSIIKIYLRILGILLIMFIFQIRPATAESRAIFDGLYVIGLPCVVLCTLFFSVGSNKPKWTNILRSVGTILAAVGLFLCLFVTAIIFGNYWKNNAIVYEHIGNSEHTINEQIFDQGALGYGGTRIVEVQPFLGVFNIICEVDTTKLDHKQWIRVDREGDIKYP